MKTVYSLIKNPINAWLIAIGLLTLAPRSALAQFHGFTIIKSDTPSIVHVGDTVLARGLISNADQNGAGGDAIIITNAYNVTYNFNSPVAGCPFRITNIINLSLVSSNIVVTNACLGTTQTYFGILLPFGNNVSQITVSNTWTVTCDAAANGYTIPDLFVAEGVDTRNQDSFPCPLASANNNPASVRVLAPCISCTKFCTNGVGENGQITFGGSVLNCGNEPLVNVFIENNQPTNHTPILGPITLLAGSNVVFSGSYPGSACVPTADIITVRGTEANQGQPVILSTTNTCTATCSNITTPCIIVTKTCSPSVVRLCGTNSSVETFSGIVSNCGNITLTNVTVTDSLLGNGVVLRLASLAPNASAPWTTNFNVTAALCGQSNILNTATARGTDCRGRSVTNTASCTFSVICANPRITVTKACASPVGGPSSSLVVTGLVCNTGDDALTNVVVTDSLQNAVASTNTVVIGTLAVGACAPYSFTYTPSSIAACSNGIPDMVTATGNDAVCGIPVSATASATCFICCPAIAVTKLVTCLQPGATCPAPPDSYAPSATGVKGNTGIPSVDDPAFCYLITVRNTGQSDLTNVTVIDDKLGSLLTGGNLAVGHSITFSNLVHAWDTTTTNTVIATAQCGGIHASGASVSATTNAVAIVIPANIACQKLVSVNGSTPSVNEAPACTTIASNITWYVTVTNTGSATLCNITITDLGGHDLLPCGGVNITLTNCLAPGQGTGLIPVCTTGFNTCVATNINNAIRVVGHVPGSSNVCAVNIGGSNVVAESSCNASLTLTCCPMSLGCRVTGGGRQDFPQVCPDDVRYVTHGGQVGAPVGNSNCVVLAANQLGNPCIHGRWTHVRHMKGGLEGNFHARYFDTLDCACLDTAFLNTNTCQYMQGIVVDGVCGNRLIGPEPRKAPANKIVFTGVGDWACPNGMREPRSCLFRVDIEDRGEPGNDHVLDLGKKPGRVPDRYRIRIWVLSDLEQQQLNSGSPVAGINDPYLLNFRNCISACNGIDYQDGTCQPRSCVSTSCSVGPVGSGTITFPGGCPVRTPNIDDGGEMDNGNHQIHPQIKACP